MTHLATALVNARVIDVASTPIPGKKEKKMKKTATPVAAAPVFTATVNGIALSAPSADELVALVTKLTGSAAQTTPVAAPAVTKKAENRLGHKVFSWLDKTSSSILTFTRDSVVVPTEVYVEDNLVPNTLTRVSNGAAKAETWFSALKTVSKAKAEAMRPVVNADAVAAAFQKKLADLIGSNPKGAAMYAAAQQAK
jgi:hypothetical protein